MEHSTQKKLKARCQWPTSVIPVIQEKEIRRIMFQSQPGQILHKTLSQKHQPQKKKWTDGVIKV
jgi:hypothetical protein